MQPLRFCYKVWSCERLAVERIDGGRHIFGQTTGDAWVQVGVDRRSVVEWNTSLQRGIKNEYRYNISDQTGRTLAVGSGEVDRLLFRT